MKGSFIKNCKSVHEFKKLNNLKNEIEFVIARSFQYKYDQFNYMTNHLDVANFNLMKHRDEFFIDDKGIWHVAMFCCIRADRLMFVMSKGKDYPLYVYFKENENEKVEFHSPHKSRKFCDVHDIKFIEND